MLTQHFLCVLQDKSTVVIYQVRNEETQEEEWFCSDANSTAYSALVSNLLLQHCPGQAEELTVLPCRVSTGRRFSLTKLEGQRPSSAEQVRWDSVQP